MDGFPLNLILAVATASATIFLGFLPTKSISSNFFGKQAVAAIFAWALIAFTSPTQIIQYYLLLAFLCFAAWWNFHRDRALAGKMWLSVASGLGISIGVMLILEVTPRAFPKYLPQLNETLLLISTYTGGAVIGLAYGCFALVQGTHSGITQSLIQRYVNVLFWLLIAHAAVILTNFSIASGYFQSKTIYNITPSTSGSFLAYQTEGHVSAIALVVLLLAIILLPLSAYLAKQTASFSSRINPTRFLMAVMVLGLLTEIGARLLLL